MKALNLILIILLKLIELFVFWPICLTMVVDPDHTHEVLIGGVLLQIIWLGALLTFTFKYIIF